MHMIVYTSKAIEGTEGCLDEIINVATKNNKLKDITGALFFDNDTFLQVLEGEKADLEELLDQIALDTRHKDINILIDEAVPQRTLKGWSMKKIPLVESSSFHELNLELFRDALQNLVKPKADVFISSLEQIFSSENVDKILLETMIAEPI